MEMKMRGRTLPSMSCACVEKGREQPVTYMIMLKRFLPWRTVGERDEPRHEHRRHGANVDVGGWAEVLSVHS